MARKSTKTINDELKSENLTIQTNINETQLHLVAIEGKIDIQTSIIKDNVKKLIDSETEISALEAQCKNEQQKLEAIKTECADTEKGIEGLKNHQQELMLQSEKIETDIVQKRQLLSDYKDSETQFGIVSTQIAKAKNELASLQQKSGDAKSEIVTLEDEIVILTAKYNDMTTQYLDQQTTREQHFQSMLGDYKSQLSDVQLSLDETKHKKQQEINTLIVGHTKQLDTLKSDLQSTNDDYSVAQDTLNQMKTDIVDSTEQLQILQDEISVFTEQYKNQRMRYDNWLNTIRSEAGRLRQKYAQVGVNVDINEVINA